MYEKRAVLAVDDEPVVRDALTRLLRSEGFSVQAVETSEEGLEALRDGHFDLVLLDLILPEKSGLDVVRKIRAIDPDVEIVLLTAFGSVETAVEATNSGVFDYLVKPFKNDELLLVINNGLERRRLTLENQCLRRSLKLTCFMQNMVGKSEVMQNAFAMIRRVAPQGSTVLITGESGSGKELAARAVHRLSARAGGPFVAVNTRAIPRGLLEAELFGHTKGAFAGALVDKKGLFEAAEGGTLFLDDVGSLTAEMQGKLLRAIRTRRIRPVGGAQRKPVDLRIVAATKSDLRAATERGEFREDLFRRLNAANICLAPLREHREDIPPLVKHFLSKTPAADGNPFQIDSKALKALVDHDWPGNVRELESVIELALVLAPPGRVVRPDHLPSEILDSSHMSMTTEEILRNQLTLKEMVAEFERNLILMALEHNDWNQRRTARVLKTIPTTLNQKMKRLKIKGS